MNDCAWTRLGFEILVTRPLIYLSVIKLSKSKLGYLVAKHSADIIAAQILEEFPEALIIKSETRKRFGIYISLSRTRPSEISLESFLNYYFTD